MMTTTTKKGHRFLSLLVAICLLLSTLLCLSSCGEAVYMTIGEAEVPYDVVKSFVKNYRAAYTEEELMQEDVRQTIREAVMLDLRQAFAVRSLAQEHDLALNSTDRDSLEEAMAYYRSAEGYEEMLVEMNATDDVFETLVELTYYDNLVYDMLTTSDARFATDNDTIDADLESGEWYAAEYVILTVDSVNKETRREALEEARQAILGGSAMRNATSSLSTLYGTEYVYATEGCFTTTIFSKDFENTVRALAIGEVSEVIESTTSDGYPCLMLLRRTAISDSYVDTYYDTIIAYYLAREYSEYMEAYAASLEVVIEDKYRDMDIVDID